jgi:hypothetical protein
MNEVDVKAVEESLRSEYADLLQGIDKAEVLADAFPYRYAPTYNTNFVEQMKNIGFSERDFTRFIAMEDLICRAKLDNAESEPWNGKEGSVTWNTAAMRSRVFTQCFVDHWPVSEDAGLVWVYMSSYITESDEAKRHAPLNCEGLVKYLDSYGILDGDPLKMGQPEWHVRILTEKPLRTREALEELASGIHDERATEFRRFKPISELAKAVLAELDKRGTGV